MDQDKSVVEYCQQAVERIDNKFKCDIMVDDRNNRVYLSMFSGKSIEWKVEITLSMFDKAQKWSCGDSGDSFENALLRECLLQLLKNNFDIEFLEGEKVLFQTQSDFQKTEINNALFSCFNRCKGFLDPIVNPVLIISDKPRMGKAIFIKWYLNKIGTTSNQYWIDFNGGNMDFVDVLIIFLTSRPTATNYFVLDNLECCGFRNSKKILSFFFSLVSAINDLPHDSSSAIRQRMFLIQDSTMMVYRGKQDYNSPQIAKVIENALTEGYEDNKTYNSYIGLSFDKACRDVSAYIKNNKNNKKAIALLAKILFFSKYDLNYTLRGDEITKKSVLMSIAGIKITRNNDVISFSSQFSERLLTLFEQCFIDGISKQEFNELSEDFLGYYYKYINESPNFQIAIPDLLHIIEQTNNPEAKMTDMYAVLKKAESGTNSLIKAILESSSDCIFNNHLGEILFSSEALCAFSNKDWNILHALEKLYKHILDFYIIDPQEDRLPQISHLYRTKEGTFKDFKVNSSSNCIENQVAIHDDFLVQLGSQGQNELTEEEVQELYGDDRQIDVSLFDLYISPRQRKTFDTDKFFGTYILALLFEFEVNLPIELRDESRINCLLGKIKHNCNCLQFDDQVPSSSSEISNECFYYYPERIPWVSARTLLALLDYNDYKSLHFNESTIQEIQNIRKGICNFLMLCSIRYKDKNKWYRFWGSGTGFWNSALETSILCSFAIKLSNPLDFKRELDESLSFIKLYSNRWFDEEMLADGIWAYRIANLGRLSKENFSEVLADFVKATSKIDFSAIPQNERNDKSLGASHIAKTYIDSVRDFITVEPSATELALSHDSNITPDKSSDLDSKSETKFIITNRQRTCFSISFSFSGKYRERVHAICKALIDLGLSEKDVFYDRWHSHLINGANGDATLREIYTKKSEIIVVLLSPDYAKKTWTANVEWPAIRELINTGYSANICLLKIGDIKLDQIDGLMQYEAIFCSIDNQTPEETARFILKFYQDRIGNQ